jgi:hypothetical protein
VIWAEREQISFCREDWTGEISLIPKENFSSIEIALKAGIEVEWDY